MKQEKGQALIIIAFSLVVLAAFVGLAIDGGQLYTNRRKVQNGSDAAALAGTRLLATYISECQPGSAGNDAQVRNAVIEYARHNGVDYFAPEGDIEAFYVNENEARMGVVGAGSIPDGTTGVEVSLTMTATTSFMRVLGVDHMTASANAVAMTGPVRELGGGALPIAVYKEMLTGMSGGELFQIFDDETTYCGGLECPFEDHVPGSLHGWLNLGYIYNYDKWTADGGGPLDRTINKDAGSSGCGSSIDDPKTFISETGLRGWSTAGCNYPLPLIAGNFGALNGDFIHGEPGTVASTISEIDSSYPPGSQVVLPIFDYVYDPGTMASEFSDRTPSIGWATGGGGSNAAYHHIVGFVTAQITEVKSTGNPKYIEG
ncbi:MAG: pilus assembly protein TadG-related protein, partial [Anaerolineae bacterium]|nr:pilus assembly protein TadG-related protein [Anaerolineae bacterium]